MKKTTDFAAIVMEKKEMLSILQECMELLDRLDDDARKEFRATGDQEQSSRWNDEEGKSCPVYLDEDGKQTFEVTDIPCMVDTYDYLPKLEFTKEDEAKLSAIEKVKQTLAALA